MGSGCSWLLFYIPNIGGGTCTTKWVHYSYILWRLLVCLCTVPSGTSQWWYSRIHLPTALHFYLIHISHVLLLDTLECFLQFGPCDIACLRILLIYPFIDGLSYNISLKTICLFLCKWIESC